VPKAGRTHLLVAVATIAALVGACQSGHEPSTQAKSVQVAEFVKAAPGEVGDLVRTELMRAKADDRRLIVYVGASWCEPCEYFREAVAARALPAEMNDLRFLEFDNDVDDERLERANYGGQMIPRFVLPMADGRGGKRRFEGSIKGPGAVDNILPKLRWLLAPAG
jgi:hypothetical protein